MTVTQLQTADTATMGDMLPVSVDWEQLFREQRHRLHHFIRKRVSNLQDVEDLEQMTWLEVLRNRDKFAGASRPETWVFGIALNLGHCCKVSDEAAFCLIQRPYISKTLLTRRISPRGSP